MAIRVLIADDHSMIRRGFRMILDDEPEIEVVSEAADGEQATAGCRKFSPDVALMDIRMPTMDGLEATRRLVADQSATRVIILTTFDLDEYVYEALRAGAAGFLLKNSPPEQLVHAVRVVSGGEALLDPAITRRVIERFATVGGPATPSAELDELTDRERQVLELVASGRSNAEIASELVVSMGTVKTHVGNTLSKLGCRDRTQAVVFAYEQGVVTPGD